MTECHVVLRVPYSLGSLCNPCPTLTAGGRYCHRIIYIGVSVNQKSTMTYRQTQLANRMINRLHSVHPFFIVPVYAIPLERKQVWLCCCWYVCNTLVGKLCQNRCLCYFSTTSGKVWNMRFHLSYGIWKQGAMSTIVCCISRVQCLRGCLQWHQ